MVSFKLEKYKEWSNRQARYTIEYWLSRDDGDGPGFLEKGDLAWAKRIARHYKIKVPTKTGRRGDRVRK